MAVPDFTKTVLFLTVCLLHDAQAAISPLETSYTATVDKNYTIPWQYDNPSDMDQVFWSFKSSAGATAATIMTRDNGSPAQVLGFNVEHDFVVNVDNGNIKLIKVDMNNSGIYFCQVSYSFASGFPTVTGTATLSVTQDCTCKCQCKKKCKRIVIPAIVLGCLGMIDLPVVYGGTVTGFFDKKIALAVDFFGIAFDVISAILGIVVRDKDCCKEDTDCCEEDPDCCEEDPDCCEDSDCKENWIEHSAIAFIVIGFLFGILAIALFYLVWSGKIGPGNNAYKAKEAKHPGENHGMTGTSM